MQLRYETGLTGEEYVRAQAWRAASLERCPNHPHGGCSLARHGTYPRKTPRGTRIARWYCPESHATISLLPDCLAARLPGELDTLEAVVAHAEQAPSLADANDRAYRALEQMRTLWAAEPCLAPRGPAAAALRLGPETPSAHRPAELSRLDDAVRPRRLLVWRVPCTSPERAIVGNCGLSGLRLALAKPVSFELCTHSLDTPVVLRPTPAHARPMRTVRAEAVERIVERVAEYWGPCVASSSGR